MIKHHSNREQTLDRINREASRLTFHDVIKDVHCRQKLTTDFFKLLELTILVVTISVSRKEKYAYRGFRGSFLRGLITKS